MMPAFSRAMSAERRAGELVVIHPDVGDDRHVGGGHVRGVPAAEQPDLEHHHVDSDVGEPAERRRRQDLEVARSDPDEQLEVGDRRDLLGEARRR